MTGACTSASNYSPFQLSQLRCLQSFLWSLADRFLSVGFNASLNSHPRSTAKDGPSPLKNWGRHSNAPSQGATVTGANTNAPEDFAFLSEPLQWATTFLRGLSPRSCSSISSIRACTHALALFLAPSFPINTRYRLIFNLRAARVSPIPSLYARILKLSVVFRDVHPFPCGLAQTAADIGAAATRKLCI